MTFFADGRFTARDLMSPCPPQARCVWSGIIEWSGGWSLAGSTVTLIPSPGGRIPEAAPATLTLINDDPPGLAEKAGDVLCAYAPQP